MSDPTTWGVIVAGTGALAVYAIKYFNDLRLEKAKAEIKLLSDQIQYLYGPLYALCSTNNVAWETFRSKYRPGRAFFSEQNPPSASELEAWRRWTSEIFMPINRAIVDLILKNAHLVEGSTFPACFAAIVSHVKPYEIVVANWAKGDFSEHTAFSNYPEDLNSYVADVFSKLKVRQAKLLQQIRI